MDAAEQSQGGSLSRRELLGSMAGQSLAGAVLAGATWSAMQVPSSPVAAAAEKDSKMNSASAGKIIRSGKIKQSIVHWCYKDTWSEPQLIEQAHTWGLPAIELIDPKYWPLLKERNMTCAIASSHGFVKGLNNPAHWDECLAILRKRIEQCAEFGFPSVITFTGMREQIPDDVGQKNCVEGFKKIIGFAEEKKVTLCLEMLNTRDSSHPMKGHPGYQGDHTEYCIEICKRVGSPRLKLLFDIYHVQIMDGDVIRRIHQHKDFLGHIHTAGNPGRGELDNTQEINYPAVMQALLDVGYQGYVGQEFIPTRDAHVGLSEAIRLCDV